MALGKAVAAEAFELLEGPLGEVRVVAVARPCRATSLSRNCETPPVNLKVAMARRSWSASRGREAGAFDRDPHRLLLEQRHAERLAEHLLQLRLRIVDRLLALAPAQIGMHHVALDRAGPDDRDLDDEIVEGRVA